MRVLVVVASLLVGTVTLSCATLDAGEVGPQLPDDWAGGTAQEFYAAKSECEARARLYSGGGALGIFVFSPASDWRCWRECMLGKGWALKEGHAPAPRQPTTDEGRSYRNTADTPEPGIYD